MVGFICLTVLALSASALGRPARRAMAVHDSREGVPAGFASAKVSAASQDTVTLRIGLAPTDIAGLEETLYSISTPGSASYGQYLSKEEVINHLSYHL